MSMVMGNLSMMMQKVPGQGALNGGEPGLYPQQCPSLLISGGGHTRGNASYYVPLEQFRYCWFSGGAVRCFVFNKGYMTKNLATW